MTRDRSLWRGAALACVWINVSEVARYFLLVRPLMARAFAEVSGIVPNTPAVGLSWTIWETLLIAVTIAIGRLVFARYGTSARAVLAAGTLMWAAVFALLWLGLLNMGLATLAIAAAALPLAWLELVIAAWLVAWPMRVAAR